MPKRAKILLKYFIALVIVILLSLKFCRAQEFIISDYDFTKKTLTYIIISAIIYMQWVVGSSQDNAPFTLSQG